MKQVCLRCAREAPMNSLWCQESTCATGDKPTVLEPGELLGDIEIVRRVAVLRTAILYAAERARRPVMLKVAHAGMQDRLKREGAFLAGVPRGGTHPPALPVLMPAYVQADVLHAPTGRAIVRDQAFTYLVLQDTPGKPLRDILLRNPQPWYQHGGWLMLTLADAILWMHQSKLLHLCLSPESVLVRYDREGIPRPLLIDLGTVARPEEAVRLWNRAFVSPAYLAPELHGQPGSRPSAYTDVYGLGLILYELLAGHPAFSPLRHAGLETDTDFFNARPPALDRPDLRGLPEIAMQAISTDYRLRPPHVISLARELQACLPGVPKEKVAFRPQPRTLILLLSAILAVALLLTLALSLGGAVG